MALEAPDNFEDLLGPDGRAIKRAEAERAAKRHKFPAEPEKDLLLFLAEHAPALEDWQRDILLIVREEMQYFVPQMQTKVMNEGWASASHARIMREMDLPDADYAAFAQMHSGVLAASRTHINPYLLGYRILEDIERRWDNPTEEEREAGPGTRAGARQALRGARDRERRLAAAQLPDQRPDRGSGPLPLRQRG